ncbi:MAG TPA: FxSxx-COOH system tetratricopeptide repeat protein, partial [Blastocatellia bacterium]|nr:FxSxx-COOH system tetratricopeptide repeat protein [Blastocatellia bacterium]
MEDQRKDFFISYTAKDREWAEWIAWQLEEDGYSVVVQAWDFRPGGNFMVDMQKATEAERTIAVLSPDYLQKPFPQAELAAAFAEDPNGESKKLLPVRVVECSPKGLLAQIICIDLVNKNETEARDELLKGVNSGRVKPAIAPRFPHTPSAPRAIAYQPQFPGARNIKATSEPPGVWNIPFRRNPHFTGRHDLLFEIRKALFAGGVAPMAQPQAIIGLGGIGKTQLAVEYAYRHAREYDIVWWVRSEEPITMGTDFAGLGPELRPPIELAADLDRNVTAVKRRLEQTSRWLVIFDNAPDVRSVAKIMPGSSTGHILITSRAHNWLSIARTLWVEALYPDDAVKFLLERTGQSDRNAADYLACVLGYLPLALEQAGAYIETTGKPIADYLDLFRDKQLEMIKRGRPATDYEATVANTWNISFQSLRNESPAAADLLNLLAFFAPEAIRREWIIAGAESLPETLAAAVTDELAFDEITAAFRRYSLVEVGAERNSFTVHRLVQTVSRSRMTDDESAKWAEAAARLVNEAFPGGEFYKQPDTWPLCGELLLHALSVTERAETFKVANEQAASLLDRLGVYLRVLARYTEAKGLLERALAIDETSFGPDHPDVATHVSNLALVLKDMGDFAQARALYERALATDEASFGPDHPCVAIDVNNLASVLLDLGDLAQARKLFERALATDEASFGPDHPRVAIDVNNLANVLQGLGDLAQARKLFERALAIDETSFGPDHPRVATDVNNLARVLHDLGDLSQALTLYERAFQIDEASFGLYHPNVAIRVNNLAGVLKDLGDLAQARALFERALAIDEASFGHNHPNVARDVNNLAGVLKDLGDLARARKLLERALAIGEASFGTDHPNVARYVKNLAGVLQDLGDFAQARALYERALAIFRKFLGND